jgi:hypothetical protein
MAAREVLPPSPFAPTSAMTAIYATRTFRYVHVLITSYKYVSVSLDTHTHTHTHTYIYIYIWGSAIMANKKLYKHLKDFSFLITHKSKKCILQHRVALAWAMNFQNISHLRSTTIVSWQIERRKNILLTDLRGPLDCEKLRILHCLYNLLTNGSKIFSLTHWPLSAPQKYFLARLLICVKCWVNPRA